MRAAVVLATNPVADGTGGMLDVIEGLSVGALLLQRRDDALDHAVLLVAVRRDELLLQSVASNQKGVFPSGEDEAILGPSA